MCDSSAAGRSRGRRALSSAGADSGRSRTPRTAYTFGYHGAWIGRSLEFGPGALSRRFFGDWLGQGRLRFRRISRLYLDCDAKAGKASLYPFWGL